MNRKTATVGSVLPAQLAGVLKIDEIRGGHLRVMSAFLATALFALCPIETTQTLSMGLRVRSNLGKPLTPLEGY